MSPPKLIVWYSWEGIGGIYVKTFIQELSREIDRVVPVGNGPTLPRFSKYTSLKTLNLYSVNKF